MTTSTPKQSLPRVLGEIAFLIAMSTGIVAGVPMGLARLLPASFCMAIPVSDITFVMSIVVWTGIALPKGKNGLRPLLRLGAVMLAGTVLAFIAARLVVGCTPVAGWDEHAHSAVAIFIMLAVVTPLAHLHRRVIEPRWARAMGEGGEIAREDEGEK